MGPVDIALGIVIGIAAISMLALFFCNLLLTLSQVSERWALRIQGVAERMEARAQSIREGKK